MFVSADYLNSGLTIYADGGALNNQEAESRKAYGSFVVIKDGKVVQSTHKGQKTDFHRFEFGSDTNNAAELKTLLEALEYCSNLLERGYKSAAPITICMDSQLALLAAAKGVKKPAQQLAVLYMAVRTLAVRMKGRVEFCKIDEQDMKRVLGH